jgi:hypothetical protein
MRDSRPYVAIRPICDALKLDWSAQRQRIKRDAILNEGVVMITTVAEDGKKRQMVCLPLDYFNGWFFGVDESRVDPSVREKLIHYKRECYSALHNHFFGNAATSTVSKKETDAPVIPVRAHTRRKPSPPAPQFPFDQINRELVRLIRVSEMLRGGVPTLETLNRLIQALPSHVGSHDYGAYLMDLMAQVDEKRRCLCPATAPQALVPHENRGRYDE